MASNLEFSFMKFSKNLAGPRPDFKALKAEVSGLRGQYQ